MTSRTPAIVVFVLILLGSVTQVSADWLFGIPTEIKRRQCWPEPFVSADRATVRAPFVTMVANGWRRQNMLGEFHFEAGTGQLNEAGRLKVRWILTAGPQQHRLIYVHIADTNEETSARLAAVKQCVAQITPNDVPPILATAIPDDGSPADQVDMIGRKYQQSVPSPRLPATSSGTTGGTGGNP
jgi:hypothetical protein